MATKILSFWDRVKRSSDTTSLILEVNNLVVFKRDGKTTFSGIKDSFRDESGNIIRGADFRKSEIFKDASGKEKREFLRRLKEGTILSDSETRALVDDGGNTRPDAIRGDQDINENLKRLVNLDKMRAQKKAFEKAQEKAESRFEEREDPLVNLHPEEPLEDSPTDLGESGNITRSDALSLVDEEVQGWVNQLQASYTPAGNSTGHGN